MNKAAQAAAMERLRHLLTAFSNLRSPDELADAMAEAGCILAKLIQQGLVPSDDFYKEQAIAALAEPVPRWDTEPRAMARQGLFRMYADDKSDSPRTVLRIVERKGTSVFRQTDYANDYAQQGQRYALFVSELLAELQTADPIKPLSVPELEPEVARILVGYGKDNHISAEYVANLIKESGKQTSKSQVQKTNAYKFYADRGNKTRKPAATLTNTDEALALLGADKQIEGNKGRWVKKTQKPQR
jgi:hypothetical protein